jgi:AcrR family transcriptional regulator
VTTLATTAPVDRKQAILLSAERLFAERGYHAVSIRQIALAAGVPLALVGYYHGPKQALFEAVFRRWQPTIDARLAALEQALERGGPGLLRNIVLAFVQPVLALRASAEGGHYALLVARELLQGSAEADAVLRNIFDPMASAFIDALQQAQRGASRAQATWGYEFALGALLHHIISPRAPRLSQGECQLGDPQAATLLVDFIVGGLKAALPARPAQPPAPTPTTRRPRP